MAQIGWTSEAEADSFLGSVYGSTWSDQSATDRTALLTTAYSELRDHPNYTLAEYASTDWDAYTANQQRQIREAQQYHALDLLQNGSEARDAANKRAAGIKSYGIGRYSVSFGDAKDGSSSREYFPGTPLSQRVKDKLFPFLKDTDTEITGRFVRDYDGI